MSALSHDKCEELAAALLWGWRVKDSLLTRKLAEIIFKDQKAPSIKMFWDSKNERLDFEVKK